MAVPMILRNGCLALGIVAALPASAQNASMTTQTASPRPSTEGARPAAGVPAPHTQPRAADVPAAQDDSANSPYRETAEDAQMNRMMRNICRGC